MRNHCLTIAPDDNQYNYKEHNDWSKGLFTPSESGSKSQKQQRTSKKDYRINDTHQRKFSLLLPLPLGVNGPQQTSIIVIQSESTVICFQTDIVTALTLISVRKQRGFQRLISVNFTASNLNTGFKSPSQANNSWFDGLIGFSFNMYRHFALRIVVWMMKVMVVVNLNRINMARDKSIGQYSSLCVCVGGVHQYP